MTPAASSAVFVPNRRRANRKVRSAQTEAHTAEGNRNANSFTPNSFTLAACSQNTRIGLS